MKNILRKKVRAQFHFYGRPEPCVVYGYYTIDVYANITFTVFANTKSYSYKTGVCTGEHTSAQVIKTYRYNAKKHVLKIAAYPEHIVGGIIPNMLFEDVLNAINYTPDID